ncbi:MAG: type IV pilus twitching motility protein PilT [Elainellaceae cyanobacterium]
MSDATRPSNPQTTPRTPPPPPPARQRPPMSDQNTGVAPTQTIPSSPETMVRTTGVPPQRPASGAVKPPPMPTPPPIGKFPAAPASRSTTSRHKRTPGAPSLEQIVKEAFDKGFSDLHLGIGEVPRFRDRGDIVPTEYPVTDEATLFSWLHEILGDAEIQRFKESLDFDGAADYDFARVRINIFDSLLGPAMVLRLIPKKILTLEQLNLPTVFKDICHYHKGLVLITGPTGSGKSTTLAAMIDYINREMPRHIVTIEDPIEFVHKSRRALIRQREVGQHTLLFDNALKASLREDPDIILVGEMRDKETVNTALKAAQTGHLVMGTLHTNSAVKTVERVLSLYEPDQQAPMRVSLAESLVAVVAQGLCRTTDGKRAAFHDILINTDAIKDYIIRGDLDSVQELIPKCTFDGMCTMNQSLYSLYEAGRITEEIALEMSPRPNEMAMTLRGRI